jgi:hypothetical protein
LSGVGQDGNRDVKKPFYCLSSRESGIVASSKGGWHLYGKGASHLSVEESH